MPSIIIKGDGRDAPLLPNHDGATTRLNENVLQDRSGVGFTTRPRGYKSGDPKTDCTILMSRPAILQCPREGCGSKEFRIIADDSSNAASGLIQIVCAARRCGNLWPVLQLSQPSVNDIMAKRIGLVLPDKQFTFDTGDDDAD